MCNIHGKCGEVWTIGFWVMRADRQTDRHTDARWAILRTFPASEVNIFVNDPRAPLRFGARRNCVTSWDDECMSCTSFMRIANHNLHVNCLSTVRRNEFVSSYLRPARNVHAAAKKSGHRWHWVHTQLLYACLRNLFVKWNSLTLYLFIKIIPVANRQLYQLN